MSRPEHLVFITATGTEVGKTWTTCRLLEELRGAGVRALARKPAQSFEPGEEPCTDAVLLAQAGGCRPQEVTPAHRWYSRALAPPMAAEALGLPLATIAELAGETVWPAGCSVGLVEGAGGLASPLGADGDNLDLALTLGCDQLVLVAHAGLGTINDVRLCLYAREGRGGPPALVLLNRYRAEDPLHEANRGWLVERCGFSVLTAVSDLAERLAPDSLAGP